MTVAAQAASCSAAARSSGIAASHSRALLLSGTESSPQSWAITLLFVRMIASASAELQTGCSFGSECLHEPSPRCSKLELRGIIPDKALRTLFQLWHQMLQQLKPAACTLCKALHCQQRPLSCGSQAMAGVPADGGPCLRGVCAKLAYRAEAITQSQNHQNRITCLKRLLQMKG